MFAFKICQFIPLRTQFYRFESVALRSTTPNQIKLDDSSIVLNNAELKEKQKPAVEKLYEDHIPTTCFQKVILTVGSSIGAITNQYRHDLVAILGETTGTFAAEKIKQKMMSDSEGSQILCDKPRINSSTVDLNYLRTLPEDSFGYSYIKFLTENNISPDTRQAVHFVDDAELAYVIQRYREIHDFNHLLLGMPTNMLGEVVIKWFEAIQTGLPMCISGALLGPIKLKPKQRKLYLTSLLPWVLECAVSAKFSMNVYYEKRWEQSLASLKHELNIKEPPLIA